MAITCRRCGAEYDATLFQFDHCIQCDCGAWVELASGHVRDEGGSPHDAPPPAEPDGSHVAGDCGA
ncbi:MAG: hypothetical protein PHO07_05790 [Pirellulales bacterium]|jgi:hypothetical protein|nr:hypothetical protein [Thermoguttaceae bacterium]MDD4786669.1 hypothetical protein [Pirellulales bacterium]MDI9444959.1 hypothetical protein [Planctomycetota bacterium]